MKNKSKKKVIRLIIAVLTLLAVLALLWFGMNLFSEKIGFTERRDDIFYFPVDYNENIYDDLVYVSKYRDVKFDYYGTAVYVNEENLDSQSREAKFFYNYFHQTQIDYTLLLLCLCL